MKRLADPAEDSFGPAPIQSARSPDDDEDEVVLYRYAAGRAWPLIEGALVVRLTLPALEAQTEPPYLVPCQDDPT